MKYKNSEFIQSFKPNSRILFQLSLISVMKYFLLLSLVCQYDCWHNMSYFLYRKRWASSVIWFFKAYVLLLTFLLKMAEPMFLSFAWFRCESGWVGANPAGSGAPSPAPGASVAQWLPPYFGNGHSAHGHSDILAVRGFHFCCLCSQRKWFIGVVNRAALFWALIFLSTLSLQCLSKDFKKKLWCYSTVSDHHSSWLGVDCPPQLSPWFVWSPYY